jgi:hypothetical protein
MDRWVFSFINDWKQLRGKWNWYTFTFIQIEFENDVWTHGVECYFVLLGIGVRIRYNKSTFDRWADDLLKNSEFD